MLNKITSRQNNKIKEAASLKDGKGKFFLVEGFHLVEMALEKGMATTIFITKEPLNTSIPQYLVTPEIIAKLSSTRSPEGIVAICKKSEEEPFSSDYILALDEISDPGNLGTCLRSALAFGYKDVLLNKKGVSHYNPKALLASQGAIFKLNVVVADDFLKRLESLKRNGYPLIATDLRGKAFEKMKLPTQGVLILGNEARGVSKEVIKISDYAIRISMGAIDSLNVGVACGILLHAIKEGKQR